MRQRLLTFPLGFPVTASTAFQALYASAENAFWLDSSSGAPGTRSYLGSSTRTLISQSTDTTMFDALRAGVAAHPIAPAGDRFALGWVGWLGYELRGGTTAEPVSHAPAQPTAAFLWADRALEIDHSTGEVTLLALGDQWEGELRVWRDEVTEALRHPTSHESSQPAEASAPLVTGVVAWRYSDERYLAMIGECQRAIRAGDAYQLCLTSEAFVETSADPLAVYLALRRASPVPHGGFIRVGEVALLSASPEQFLAVSPDGVVESKPIKGTRARGGTAEADERLRAELLASDKERAENLMIVDLMRNDIGRVSEVGSVSVPSLLAVESYAQVHQLVSTVRGRLAPGLDGIDAVVSCFPAGSMTGAPKLSATRILDRLEDRPRGIYSGAFGYFSLDGRVDLAMVIRSIVIDPSGATVGAGGGITALSVPEEELAEVKLKAEALLAVLGAAAG
ncbi:aminodeoxychorismate synthase component I [Salinibacterium sp. ZJ454]|uniref:aminodeoxychorismate synthase component I n=1 Tax=Salinibacterium sp. ZJ454 TaxID=2708339 RepID=UPI0014246766|nr:aminodeoxychorismate synthase component I [Salinibacterium sp. ZJ454]